MVEFKCDYQTFWSHYDSHENPVLLALSLNKKDISKISDKGLHSFVFLQ